MDIAENDFSGKVVLEVGTGRGDTTRKLVELLSHFPNSLLITSDISDQFFKVLQEELGNTSGKIEFRKTDGTKLDGIEPGSIDYIVCNYTLCAINSHPGQALLALTRFFEVLRNNGKLYVEEEMPIEAARNSAQEIWAEKWRILRTVEVATNKFSLVEFSPETLAELCRISGFCDIEYREDFSVFSGNHFLDFFHQRLERSLSTLPNDDIRNGIINRTRNIQEKADQIGFMEVPFYRLVARKPIE